MKPNTPRAEEVFLAALELRDPAARGAHLDRECAGDAALRREVESLLAAHAAAGEFLDTTAPGGAGTRPPAEQAGERIGRYKLLEQIGEGGFGVVWMAEQEEPVRRRVALKIIKLGMDTREVVARFEAERQALAMMDHPHIASVFDGGATAAGRPYFVMELVQGIPLTQFCDERRLPARERLTLFMQVCEAVQHAHQKGVIHRDLKPSNILVTVKDDRAVPKVIDFGIAKATQGRLSEKTIFTRFQQWIGTPAYMSPEQAGLGSQDVDTRSDVYSLGVLLYELLTGRTPFDTKQLLAAGYEAVLRKIRDEEPPKPSTRLSTLAEAELGAVAARRGLDPARLSRLVRGDLDWIVMKALEKDRQRRYDTAAALAQDLGRHLRAEPVLAAAPSAGYRLAKFVRRNRLAVATVAVLALTLVTATVVSLHSAATARKARKVASAQRSLAEASAEESRRRLLNLNTAHGLQMLERGDWLGAALWFCDALGRAGTNDAAVAATRLRLGATLGYAPRLAHAWFHDAPVQTASFSPDGRRVLVADRAGFARFWELATERPVGSPMRHAGAVLAARFSRDGRFVVTAGDDLMARVWEAGSGRAVSPPLVHRLPLRAVGFSPDGQQVITASSREGWAWSPAGELESRQAASEVRRWETLTGQESPGVHRRATNLVQFAASPAARRYAVALGDGSVRLLDEQLTLERTLTGPARKAVNSLAFSPDGKHLATADAAGHGQLHPLDPDARPRTLRARGGGPDGGQAALLQVVFSPDGQRIATLAGDGTVAFWSVPGGQLAGQLDQPSPGATALEFSPDGRFVAVVRAAAGGAGEVRLWEVAAGRAASPTLPHAGTVTSVGFHPDGHLLLTASLDGGARVWDLTTLVPSLPPLYDSQAAGHGVVKSPAPEHSLDVLFTPDGQHLATLGGNGQARMWDVASGQPSTPVIQHQQPSPIAAFSHDGQRLAIGSRWDRGAVRVFAATNGQPVSPAWPQRGEVRRLAFTPDERGLVIIGETNAQVLDAVSGAPLPLAVRRPPGLRDIRFSPDGRWVVTTAEATTSPAGPEPIWRIQVWQAASGEALGQPLELGQSQVERFMDPLPRLAFSDDGRWLAASSRAEVRPPGTETAAATPPLHVLELRPGTAFSPAQALPGVVTDWLLSSASPRLVFRLTGEGALAVRALAAAENPVPRQPQEFDFRLRQSSQDGRWLLGWVPGGWRVWEAASGLPVTPVLGERLEEVWCCQGQLLAPDGRVVVAGSAARPQLWPLRPDPRPLDELTREVQLLAARELDASGSLVLLGSNRLSQLWGAVRAARPAASAPATNPAAGWHLHQAGQSEQAGQWFAAEFHLRRLRDTAYDGPRTRQRLAHARNQAALESLNQDP